MEAVKLAEYERLMELWDAAVMDRRRHDDAKLDTLQRQHGDELDKHRRAMLAAEPKPHWSPQILALRRAQEVLTQKRDFAKLWEVRARIEALEREEYQAHLRQWEHKVQVDQANLMDRQARETAALRKKLATAEQEARIAHERQVDMLVNKYQASKAALHHAQRQELLAVKQAVQGRLAAPSKLGIAVRPSSAQGTAWSAGGGQVSRPKRPGTARPKRPATAAATARRPPALQVDAPSTNISTASQNGSDGDDDWRGAISPDGVYRTPHGDSQTLHPDLPRRGEDRSGASRRPAIGDKTFFDDQPDKSSSVEVHANSSSSGSSAIPPPRPQQQNYLTSSYDQPSGNGKPAAGRDQGLPPRPPGARGLHGVASRPAELPAGGRDQRRVSYGNGTSGAGNGVGGGISGHGAQPRDSSNDVNYGGAAGAGGGGRRRSGASPSGSSEVSSFRRPETSRGGGAGGRAPAVGAGGGRRGGGLAVSFSPRRTSTSSSSSSWSSSMTSSSGGASGGSPGGLNRGALNAHAALIGGGRPGSSHSGTSMSFQSNKPFIGRLVPLPNARDGSSS